MDSKSRSRIFNLCYKTTTRSVSEIVSSELSGTIGTSSDIKTSTTISASASASLNKRYENSVTTTYSASETLKYNLKDYPKYRSVKIASMGYIDNMLVSHYVNGQFQSRGYLLSYGSYNNQEIKLVHK